MDLALDKETVAIQSIISSLTPLVPNQQRRVLDYVISRYGSDETHQQSHGKSPDEQADKSCEDYADVADLFEKAKPQSCSERALVIGYWFQVIKAQKDFESRALTPVVAQLGHPTKNITRDLRPLLSGSPKLVIQVGKGSSGASHRYRLTAEGTRIVQNMITGQRS